MINHIVFVTTNPGKNAALSALAANFGLIVEQVEADLIEPQASSVVEVAANKAAQAVKLIGQPVVVEDTGFVIDVLNGFPGAYIKYALETIGTEGLVRLAAPFPSAACRFVSALCYAAPDGTRQTFVDDSATGTLAKVVDPAPALNAWSELWRIFIPTGYDKTLSVLAVDERNTLMRNWQAGSVYGQFIRWMVNQTNGDIV